MVARLFFSFLLPISLFSATSVSLLPLCVKSFSLFPQRRSQVHASRRQSFPRLSRLHAQLQHHQPHPHAVSRRTQSVLRNRHTSPASLHQYPHRPPLQLLICHHRINHQVFINMPQPYHHRCTQHVQHHLLRSPRLQPRRPRQNLRPHSHRNRNFCQTRQRHIPISHHRDGRRPAPSSKFHRSQNVRRSSACRDPDHHVLPPQFQSPQIPRPIRRRIFRAFHRPCHSPPPPRNQSDHLLSRNPKRRRTLRRIQHRHPPARSRPHINQTPAAAHRRNNRIHRPRNRRQLLPHRRSHAPILAVHQPHNLRRRHPIEILRHRQPRLR